MASWSLIKVRRTQKLSQNKLITLLDKQGGEIHDHAKIEERTDALYTQTEHIYATLNREA